MSYDVTIDAKTRGVLSFLGTNIRKKDGKDYTKIVFVVSFLFLCMKKRNEKIRIWEKEKKAESA